MKKIQQKKDNVTTSAGLLPADEYNNIGQELNSIIEVSQPFDEHDKKQLAKGIWVEGRAMLYVDVSAVENKIHLKRKTSEHQVETLQDGVAVFFKAKRNSTDVTTIKINETPEKRALMFGKDAGSEETPILAGHTYCAIYRNEFDETAVDDVFEVIRMSSGLEGLKIKTETTNGNTTRILVDDSDNPVSLVANPGDADTEYQQASIIAKDENFMLLADSVAGNKDDKLGVKYVSESPGDDSEGNPLPKERKLEFYAGNEKTGDINITTGYHSFKKRLIQRDFVIMSQGAAVGERNQRVNLGTEGVNYFYESIYKWWDSSDYSLVFNDQYYDAFKKKIFDPHGDFDIIQYGDLVSNVLGVSNNTGTGLVFHHTGFYEVDLIIPFFMILNDCFRIDIELRCGYYNYLTRKGITDHDNAPFKDLKSPPFTPKEMGARGYPVNTNPLPKGWSEATKSRQVSPFAYNGIGPYKANMLIKVEKDTIGPEKPWFLKFILKSSGLSVFYRFWDSLASELKEEYKYSLYGVSAMDYRLAQQYKNKSDGEPFSSSSSTLNGENFLAIYQTISEAGAGSLSVKKVGDI